MNQSAQRWLVMRWVIWGFATLFYFYEYLIRVAPSVMVGSLMATFAINAEQVGMIGGFYFYAYAPMQLFVGLAYDRFKASKLLAISAFICGLATCFFGISQHVWEAELARLLIGFASAFAFVGMIYITSHWFKKKWRALLIGLANSVAMVGAISGEGPLSLLEKAIGWRLSLGLLGVLGLFLSVFIFLAATQDRAKKQAQMKKAPSFRHAFADLKSIVKERVTWLNAVISLLFYATTIAIAGLWGVPFLMQTHGLSQNEAGFANSMIYVGWLIGGPLTGYLSDFVHGKRLIMLWCSFLGCASVACAIYFAALPTFAIYILLCAIGLFSSAQLLTYSFAIDQHPARATGSAVAFTNFTVTLGGVIFQPLVGYILDFFWKGSIIDGVRMYSSFAYKAALSLFPATFALAFILTWFLKEKKYIKQ